MISKKRVAARDTYDVLVGLTSPSARPQSAYAVVKRTYQIVDGALRLTAPEPLRQDTLDDRAPSGPCASIEGSPLKPATDVLVRGDAFAPKGAATRMLVAVRAGEAHKRVVVFGRRIIHWGRGGALRIGSPEPFERIALTYDNAYGGVDRRAHPHGQPNHRRAVPVGQSYRGVYPRNPFGKGYLLDAGSVTHTTEMPNAEDPRDLLTADRLLLDDPRQWHKAPLPACFDRVHPMMFPRSVWSGADVGCFAPPAELPEVRRGLLPADYPRRHGAGIHPRFYQEATPELVLDHVSGGEPFVIEGMHPERAEVSFTMPRTFDTMSWLIEGQRFESKPAVQSILVEPARGRVHVVLGAAVTLPRLFPLGAHGYFPISVSVSGDKPFAYEHLPSLPSFPPHRSGPIPGGSL